MSWDEIWQEIRSALSSYSGAKLICAFFYTASLAVALAIIVYSKTNPSYISFSILWDYILRFWLSHKPLVVIFLLIWLSIFCFDAFESQFYKFVSRAPLSPHDTKREVHFRRIRWFFYSLTLVFTFITFPFIGLVADIYTVLLPACLSLMLTAITLAISHDQFALNRPRPKLARFHYPANNFDVAGLAPASVEIIRERRLYENFGRAPMQQSTHDFIRRGLPRSIWKGQNKCMANLAQAFEVDAESIHLRRNTTAGISHALSEIAALSNATADTVLITTDAEYPGISALIDQYDRPGSLVKVERVDVKEELWMQTLQPAGLVQRIIRKYNDIHVNYRHIAICTSHVYWESALSLPIDLLRKGVGEDVHLIIDGAQAFGNIYVGAETMSKCSYYVTSGHKWLLGKQTMGITYRNPSLCSSIPVLASTDSMDSLRAMHSSTPGGTVDIEPHVALNASLTDLLRVGFPAVADHNHALAELFRDWSRQLQNSTPLSSYGSGGIVMLGINNPSRIKMILNRQHKVQTTVFNARSALRFCFHYFHSENDVYRLIERLDEIHSI